MECNIYEMLKQVAIKSGFYQLTWGHILMLCVGLVFVYLAIARRYEPYELLPIGLAIVLVNLPGHLTQKGPGFVLDKVRQSCYHKVE